MIVRVRGISYFYEKYQESSSLPTIILLHGFMGNGRVFTELIEQLKPFCNPVTIDLLGHGQTEGAELHYRFSTKEQVADLSKLIGEQITAPVFLYGYSMGARLALQLAIHRAHLFQGLILESGTFGIESETERQARQALDASRADQIMGNFEGFLKEWESMPMFKSEVSGVTYAQKSQNPTWVSNSLLGFGTGTMPCVRERLPEIITPVQLIVGEQDSKFVSINQTMNKELQHSELVIVEKTGHRVHIEKPDIVASAIKKFMTKTRLP